MLLPKNIINNKFLAFLWFRSLFFVPEILFFIKLNKQVSNVDLIRNLLLKHRIKFVMFNNNYIFESKLNLSKLYLNLFEGSFFVLFFNDFSSYFELKLDGCYLFACLYNGYFIIVVI
jgi:hypothetical protein